MKGLYGYERAPIQVWRCGLLCVRRVRFIGSVEIVDWRGNERDCFKGSSWSYDVLVENTPHFDEGPCLYKHIPECDVRHP